ncbi:Voltage-dependent anion-selective channel protein 1 [Sciurus carolinensis]|uniref:Voltage-dependent anion-selective channel protein 1 n=1 Tax=Sciurus carolinensis TaxID=30640 RepID=A0AA41MLW1_SCICA|nr:Voltage-dependent anion-selective channel protein 1 [Sciurus carolinensis]
MNSETAVFQATQNYYTVGNKTDDFRFHTNVNDRTKFGGSIYQKVNKTLENNYLSWTVQNTCFGIATKYQIHPDACFSAKVNNSSLIGL